MKRGKIAPRIRSNRKSYTRFRLVPNDLGWPWSVVMHFVSKHVRLSSELTVKIWMKIQDRSIHCQRRRCRRCSQMTLLSGNIRFVPIFEGFLGEGVSNDSGQSKTWILRLSRLCLLHVKKWCQRYYIVAYYLIPCRLSTNPEMSLNDSEWSLAYTLQYCDLHLSNYFFSLISSLRYSMFTHGAWPA